MDIFSKEIIIPITAAILGIAVPLLIGVIQRIDDKYESTRLIQLFMNECSSELSHPPVIKEKRQIMATAKHRSAFIVFPESFGFRCVVRMGSPRFFIFQQKTFHEYNIPKLIHIL